MNKNWKWVYNPFEKIAGWKAFGIGVVILCAATVIGYFSNTVFYGISIKTVASVTWGKAFSLQGLGLAITVVVMWITALLSAKRVRFQDILGTVTLAKYPLVLAAIMFLTISKRMNEIAEMFPTSLNELTTESIQRIVETVNNLTLSDYVLLMVMAIVSIFIFVWTIALLFNAFKVSTNLKGSKCALWFIAAILISEIIIFVCLLKIY